jgi:hypothetical protein
MDAIGIRVRRPTTKRAGRQQFVSGKSRTNAVKALVIADAQGRLRLTALTTTPPKNTGATGGDIQSESGQTGRDAGRRDGRRADQHDVATGPATGKQPGRPKSCRKADRRRIPAQALDQMIGHNTAKRLIWR